MFEENNFELIKDNRKDFKNTTFSNYKKSQVIKQFEKTLFDGKIEESCYWSSELVISGLFYEIIESCSIFYSKHVNINNPNIIILISESLNSILKIRNLSDYKQDVLKIRNNKIIRDNICKLTFCLCSSQKVKKDIYNLFEISIQDFKDSNFKSNIQTTKNYLISLSKQDDPRELIIAGNQLVFNIINKNINKCLYWISWIFQWDKINIQQNKKIYCHKRSFPNIEIKFNDDFIWFIWEIVINISKDYNIRNSINNLLLLFSYDYSKNKKNSRISILICAILFLIENINFDIPITDKSEQLYIALQNINILYKDINDKFLNTICNNNNILSNNNNILSNNNNILSNNNDILSINNKFLYNDNNLNDFNLSDNTKKKKTTKKDNYSEEYINSIQKLNKVEQLFNQFFL